MVEDIVRYVPPQRVGALVVSIGKTNKYTIKMSATPKGVHMTMNIVLRLHKFQYNDYEILEFLECTKDTYEEIAHGDGGLITRETTQWELELQWSNLLSIIHIPHFGRSSKGNACVK